MRIELFLRKNKKKLIIGIVLFILICILYQIYFFSDERIKEVRFDFLRWSEYCDGKVYTQDEKNSFCQSCKNGSGTCMWPLDMNFSIAGVKKIINTGGEVHCYLDVDGVSYYKETGSYFGVVEDSLFTWQKLDASKPHSVEFCCEINRESLISLFVNEHGARSCTKEEIDERCVQ